MATPISPATPLSPSIFFVEEKAREADMRRDEHAAAHDAGLAVSRETAARHAFQRATAAPITIGHTKYRAISKEVPYMMLRDDLFTGRAAKWTSDTPRHDAATALAI